VNTIRATLPQSSRLQLHIPRRRRGRSLFYNRESFGVTVCVYSHSRARARARNWHSVLAGKFAYTLRNEALSSTTSRVAIEWYLEALRSTRSRKYPDEDLRVHRVAIHCVPRRRTAESIRVILELTPSDASFVHCKRWRDKCPARDTYFRKVTALFYEYKTRSVLVIVTWHVLAPGERSAYFGVIKFACFASSFHGLNLHRERCRAIEIRKDTRRISGNSRIGLRECRITRGC